MSVSTYINHYVRGVREITCKKRDNCGKTKRSNLSQQRSKGDQTETKQRHVWAWIQAIGTKIAPPYWDW